MTTDDDLCAGCGQPEWDCRCEPPALIEGQVELFELPEPEPERPAWS